MWLKGLCLAALLAVPAYGDGLRIEVDGRAQGVIEIDLFEDIAPKHAQQMIRLAEQGFFDNVAFHRVIDGFMAQTGDGVFGRADDFNRERAGSGGSDLPDVEAEFSEIAFERGIVGMARAGDPRCAGLPGCKERDAFLNSGNSQFFIMFAPNRALDGNYTAIGRVISGMEVVDQIKRGNRRSGAIRGAPDRMIKVTPLSE